MNTLPLLKPQFGCYASSMAPEFQGVLNHAKVQAPFRPQVSFKGSEDQFRSTSSPKDDLKVKEASQSTQSLNELIAGAFSSVGNLIQGTVLRKKPPERQDNQEPDGTSAQVKSLKGFQQKETTFLPVKPFYTVEAYDDVVFEPEFPDEKSSNPFKNVDLLDYSQFQNLKRRMGPSQEQPAWVSADE